MNMSAAELVAEIAPLEGVTTRAGVSYGDLALLEDRLQLHLPRVYRELLLETNGLETTYGYARVLGSGPGAPVDLEWFNDPQTWMFAYSRHDLGDYLYLKITAEGVLLGVRREDLTAANSDPPFFSIHPLSPRPEGGTGRLSQWLDRGLRLAANNPRIDVVTSRLMDHFGPLRPDQVIMPAATYWIDGENPVEAAALLPVDVALIAQADLFRHSRELRPGDQVEGVDTWTDDAGRTRLRFKVRHRK